MDQSESRTLGRDGESSGSGEVVPVGPGGPEPRSLTAPEATWASLRTAGRAWLGEPTSCSAQEPRAPEVEPDARNHGEQGETHVTKEEAKGLPRPGPGHSPPGRGRLPQLPTQGGTLAPVPGCSQTPSPAAPGLTEFHLAGFAQALPCRQLTWCRVGA